MKYEYLIGLIIILILMSCSISESKKMNGEYYVVGNDSQTLTISDSSIIFTDTNELSDIENVTMYTDKKGNMLEAPSCKGVKYSIDSIDSNNGIYISAFKDEYRCYGYHLIRENSFLSVTPLKSLDGLEFHFTVPTLYCINKSIKDNATEKEFTILVNEDIELNKINYVAFDQRNDEVKNEYSKSEMTIKLDSKGITKSSIVINPMLYARKRYIAKFINKSDETINDIPVVFHKEFIEIKSKFEEQDQKLEFQKLNINDLYLIAYRFNPGRKRVVNKIFKEEINGQVQTFELRSLKKDYR